MLTVVDDLVAPRRHKDPTVPQATTITERIQQIVHRYEAGNVSAFARRCRLSQRAAAKMHNGETPNPSYKSLSAIARSYPVDPTWLLVGSATKAWAEGEERAKVEGYWITVDIIRMLGEILESPDRGVRSLRRIARNPTPESAAAANGLLAVIEQFRRTG